MSNPFERLERLQRGLSRGSELHEEPERDVTETIDATDHPEAIEAPEALEPEEQPQRVRGADASSRAAAPWWTRSRLNDPDGDPAAEAERSELLERTATAEPADVGVPTGDPHNADPPDAPAAAPPVPKRTAATAQRDEQLSFALADERRRLLQRRGQMEGECRRVEAEIEGVDARIGHVDALLAAEQPGGPPGQLRRIGSHAAEAA